MTKQILLLLIFFITSAVSTVHATPLGLQQRGLKNTISCLLLTGPAGEDFVIKVGPRGDTISNLDRGFERTFHLKAKLHKDSEHLVLVIPGFGAKNDSTAGPYLSELLYRNGLSVVVTHSPAADVFLEQSHSVGIAGVQEWDALDLYDMLKETLRVLKADQKLPIKKVSIVGTSLGSINAAHMLMIDKKKDTSDRIGLHKVFSLNPPISNIYGSGTIDMMVRKAKGIPETEDGTVDVDKLNTFFKAYMEILRPHRYIKTFEDVEAQAGKFIENISLDENQLQFLVGYSFQSVVDQAIQSFDKRYAQDIVDNRTYSLRRPLDFFQEYLNIYAFKTYRDAFPTHQDSKGNKVEPGIPDQYANLKKHLAFTEGESILFNYKKLQDPRYHLISWEDDFLLRSEDPEWIRKTFNGGSNGNSLVFTQPGGHLGGFYQKEFQNYLLKELKK